MIPLKIFLFAGAKEIVQTDSIRLEVSLPIKVHELREKLASECPMLKPMLAISRFACNREFVDDSFEVSDSLIEIAVIPPVSGG